MQSQNIHDHATLLAQEVVLVFTFTELFCFSFGFFLWYNIVTLPVTHS